VSPLLLLQASSQEAMIEVLEKRHRLCVLQVSRGSGPRAVEEWVHSNISICFHDPDASVELEQEKPVLASQCCPHQDPRVADTDCTSYFY
jgi:hypothetical protein